MCHHNHRPMMTTTALPMSASEEHNLNDWRRAYVQCWLMCQWAFNNEEQADMCVELKRELDVDDPLMPRVHKMLTLGLSPSLHRLVAFLSSLIKKT
jgi:hypothetical protein